MRISPSVAALLVVLAAAGCGGGARTQPREPKPSAGKAPKVEVKAPPTLEFAPEAPSESVKTLNKDASGCTWLESEATITVGGSDTRNQAHAAAIERARKLAMDDFLGVEVQSRYTDFQQAGLRDETQLTENVLQTTRNGRILKEQVIRDEYRDLPGCQACRYHVCLRSCLLQGASSSDKGFTIDLKISQERYISGNEASFTITATRDCFIYVYNVWGNWNTALILPNDVVPDAKLTEGQTFEYPDDAARRRGVKLTTEMQDEKSPISVEVIRVIAAKSRIPMKLVDPKEGGFLGVMQRMSSSRIDWAEDKAFFTIFRR